MNKSDESEANSDLLKISNEIQSKNFSLKEAFAWKKKANGDAAWVEIIIILIS